MTDKDAQFIQEYHYLYIFEEEVYDLKDWIPIHPGGSQWFVKAYRRDLTTLCHSYHKNIEMLRKILAKYKTNHKASDILARYFNIPPHVLPEGFHAAKDSLVFDWKKENTIWEQLKKAVNTKEHQEKVQKMDFLFDLIGMILFVVHMFLSFYGVTYEILPPWLLVPIFLCTRTGMAAVGHYHSHRKKDGITDWGDAIFDIQYVGTSIIAFDGHGMIHHSQTNSLADVKRTVFTGVVQIPRLWRVPAETLRRIGLILTGVYVRWISLFIVEKENWPRLFIKQFWIFLARAILLAELLVAWYTDHFWVWFAQFFVCTWYNLFLIVSSHDFESHYDTKADLSKGQDWGRFQIVNSTDMEVTGNKYIDCFLTAGLGCHRTHHILPAQKSGFSNIITEPIVKKIAEEHGIKWDRYHNFVTERFPILFRYYLLNVTPGKKDEGWIKEAFSPSGIIQSIIFVLVGFLGLGAI